MPDAADAADAAASVIVPTRVRRVGSYGEIIDPQPSLIDQARKRASSVTKLSKVPPGRYQQHSRKNSEPSSIEGTGGIPSGDLEHSFSSVVNQTSLPKVQQNL